MYSKMLFITVAVLMFAAGCDTGGVKSRGPQDVLISKGFVGNNTYKLVCRGFPLETLTGPQRTESSKRAALLNAYYFIQNEFNDTVVPDKDGRAEKFEVADDYAVVYYILSKKGLKKMTRSKME